MVLYPSVLLTVDTTTFNPSSRSYTTILSLSNAQNISQYLFVNQRIRNQTTGVYPNVESAFTSRFAAVATPEQLSSLGVNCPLPGTSFYLANTTTIVTNTLEFASTVVQEVCQELTNLVNDIIAQQNLTSASYTVNSFGVTPTS